MKEPVPARAGIQSRAFQCGHGLSITLSTSDFLSAEMYRDNDVRMNLQAMLDEAKRKGSTGDSRFQLAYLGGEFTFSMHIPSITAWLSEQAQSCSLHLFPTTQRSGYFFAEQLLSQQKQAGRLSTLGYLTCKAKLFLEPVYRILQSKEPLLEGGLFDDTCFVFGGVREYSSILDSSSFLINTRYSEPFFHVRSYEYASSGSRLKAKFPAGKDSCARFESTLETMVSPERLFGR